MVGTDSRTARVSVVTRNLKKSVGKYPGEKAILLWKQWKRPYIRAKNLMRRGLSEATAWRSATTAAAPGGMQAQRT